MILTSEVLCSIDSDIERELYIDRVAQKYKISKGSIQNEIEKKVMKKDNVQVVNIRDIARKVEMTTSARKRIEQYIIALMICKDNKIYNVLEENINENMIKTLGINRLYKYIKELANSYDLTKIDILSKIEDEELIKDITDVMYIDSSESNRYKLLEDVLKYMKKDSLQERRNDIFSKLSENISQDEKEILQVELNQINIELAKLK